MHTNTVMMYKTLSVCYSVVFGHEHLIGSWWATSGSSPRHAFWIGIKIGCRNQCPGFLYFAKVCGEKESQNDHLKDISFGLETDGKDFVLTG